MSESSLHTDLVRSLKEWVASRGEVRQLLIYLDLPELPSSERPPKIGGFYPDVYCVSDEGRPIYLGEAKTARDLESCRSRNQLTAFLRFLSGHPASALVVAVPWRVVPTARSLVRALQRLSGTTSVCTHFVEKLPG